MRRLFLGKWWHWVVLVVVCGVLWLAGDKRLHVTDFNTFIIVLLAGTIALVVGLVVTTRPGDRVTRERLEPEESD